MTRKIVDCRDMPSDIGCTLTLTGEEDEVVRAAAEHAVSMHGHTDGDDLRSAIRDGLRDAPQATGPGAFAQLIEFRTDHIDQFDTLTEQWLAEIGTDRTARWFLLGADRDQPGRYVQIVEFPSYEDAMTNSAHPATAAVADRLGKLAHGEPGFRNLDIIRAQTP
jgi:predicted small metal-binding protein/quinol monooxygenase YgiN